MNCKLLEARRHVFPLLAFLMYLLWLLLRAGYQARQVFGLSWKGYSCNLSMYFYRTHAIRVSVIHGIFLF